VPTKIAQITDLHLLAPGAELMGLDVNARLRVVLEHVVASGAGAVFLTGDCCAEAPVQEIYHQLRARLDTLNLPYYLSPGNHDDRGMMRNAFFLEGHNNEPIKGLVRVDDQDFLFLDTTFGEIEEEQLDWLHKAVSSYPHAAIVMHHPPVPMGVRFMDKKYPLRNTGRLIGILTEDGAPRRVFCGHFHSGRTTCYRNLTVHLCPPTSFFIDPAADEFVRLDLPPAYQMLEWTDEGDFRLVPHYVNK